MCQCCVVEELTAKQGRHTSGKGADQCLAIGVGGLCWPWHAPVQRTRHQPPIRKLLNRF